MATVIFNDSAHATGTGDSTSVTSTNEIATLVAINIPTSSLNYGLFTPSSTTSSTNQLANIENAGNATNTIQVQGTALTSGGTSLATSSQHYATSSFTFGGGETALSDTATTITGINTAPVFIFPLGGTGWQNTTALPYVDYEHTTVAYNNYLYVIGGGGSGSANIASSSFAPINATGSLGAWTSTRALPNTLSRHASVVYNGYLYAIGGEQNSTGTRTSTVVFAPINATGSLGAWTSTTALPYTDSYNTSVAYNGYLYTIGGCVSGTCTDSSTVVFAPINATGSIGAWTSTQALPSVLHMHASVAYNGYIYTIGGCAGSSCVVTSTVLFASINATGSLGAWTSTQALPYPDDQHTSVVYNGYLYTIGGTASTSVSLAATSTVLFAPINATGSIGAWTSTQALSNIYHCHSSAAYNGYLYMIGGKDGACTAGTSTVLFAPLNARSTYWGVSVPNGTTNGDYTDTVTLTAVFSQ